MKIQNPIIAGLINTAPGILNSVLSIIRDKKKNREGETDNTNVVHEDIAGGIAISAKRVLNLVGTGAIITTALGLIATNGVDKWNIALILIGVCYSLGMTFLTYLAERK